MLSLYRRHHRTADKCTAGHKPDSFTYESDEGRRTWKKCVCPIYSSGTLGGKFQRRNTGQHQWEAAKIVAQRWQAAGSWEDKAAVAPPPLPDDPAHRDPARISIGEATEKYLEEHRKIKSAPLTIAGYVERCNALKKFSLARGIHWLDQWTSHDVRAMHASWENGPLTRSRKLGWLRTFFNYAASQEWIGINPTDKVVRRGIRPAAETVTHVQKSPFTDAEIRRIIDACFRLPLIEWNNGAGTGSWSGQDIADFITVLMCTGLRISDVVRFDISRLNGNQVFLRQHKTKKPLFTWVTDGVRDMMLSRARAHGPKIFQQFSLSTDSTKVMTTVWRNKINKAFALAHAEAPFASRPTPHRFRHTFVRILLQQGVPLSIVAELAGDTEKVILLHYAEWCQERQELLTQTMQSTLTGPRYTDWCRGLLDRPRLAIVKKQA
jgi:integrase